MTKHDNYKTPCVATISKKSIQGMEFYELRYDDEDWCFTGTQEEILEELGEHLDNMKEQE